MSILAFRRSQWENRKGSDWPKKEPIAFPLTANVDSKETKRERSLYRFMVTYYFNLMKDCQNRYGSFRSEPELCKLRDNILSIFEPTKRSGRKLGVERGKAINLLVKKEKIVQTVYFWKKEDFSDNDLDNPNLRQIDIPKEGLPATSIPGEVLDRLLDRILKSDFWNEWEKIAEKKQEAQRPKHKAVKKKFTYLRRIEDVLEIGGPEKPTWFRKKGPIAIDFIDGRVYRREKRLNELTSLVMNNSVSMLEGVGATGKTVLVLNLAYDLSKESEVYYFDCDKDRDFDKNRLISDLKSVKGIFILENIHLAPEKFQSIYFDLKHDEDRHVLFVTRPSLREFAYSRSEDLTQIKSLKLDPFEDVEALIENFNVHQDSPEIGIEVNEQIKMVSLGSFWLLSYALRGYTEANGRGKPESWLEKGVKEDLNDLKNINTMFPEVMVVLSPLYLGEVLTAEGHLMDKLGFDYEVLDQLVKRAEITCQKTKDGVVFYGLPHSALAYAYWEHGKEYRRRKKLKEDEDFIYDYAKSGVSNGLAAVMSIRSLRDRITVRLDAEDELTTVIANERSVTALGLWIESADSEIIAKDNVLAAVARKVEALDDPSDIPGCISAVYHHGEEMGQAFWSLLDHKKVKDVITRTGKVLFVVSRISSFTSFDKIAAHHVCSLLNLKDLAARLNQVQNLDDLGQYLSKILRVNEQVGRKLWKLLDKEELTNRLNGSRDLSGFMAGRFCIHNIYCAATDIARELCGWLNLEVTAAWLNQESSINMIGIYLSTILKANQKVGRKLCQRLNKEDLAAKLSRWGNINDVSWHIRDISLTNPQMVHELCGMLNLEDVARRLNQAEDATDIIEYISTILAKNEQVGRKLWQRLDRHDLGAKISRTGDVDHMRQCIEDIYNGAYPSHASLKRRLCSLLDLNEVAVRLNQAENMLDVMQCIAAILGANKRVGRDLWRLLDLKGMAVKLSRMDNVDRTWLCIRGICNRNRTMARELCGLLKLRDLASTLSDKSKTGDRERLFEVLETANRQVLHKLRKLLDG